jgi:hypothetical protein
VRNKKARARKMYIGESFKGRPKPWANYNSNGFSWQLVEDPRANSTVRASLRRHGATAGNSGP